MDGLLIFGVIISIYMAFNIAANDIGNSVGTTVGSGSLTMRRALILGAIFEFIGALYFGNNVIKTVGSGIISPDVLQVTGAFIVTLAAALWITITIIRKIPISGSDAIISAVVGVGIVSVGVSNINWQTLEFIVLSWIFSPLIGLAAGFSVYYLLKNFFLNRVTRIASESRLEKIFSYLQIGSSAFTALNVGAIDIAVATGVLYYAFGTGTSVDIKFLGAIGIVLGILVAGGRITDTIGRRITDLIPSRGFSAQISAATVVFFFAGLGMPVSPTQTLVGTVIGVGLARGSSTIKLDVIKNIATTWVVTIPACILISASLYLLLNSLI
ncbi:MAG TPA: inorganic phosphate transporter [Methanobacteriaceae archaeon]|nr:inorganic phosphate transporter [Methanobacteriaceae archaeon]